ncbi:hypothetical protein F5I97DRAFT_140843 [Phlebopus sp. FC_14]|nr:hypothetical protein F5I97DRAFT_140843 [Phlebopus sp. FC_14]
MKDEDELSERNQDASDMQMSESGSDVDERDTKPGEEPDDKDVEQEEEEEENAEEDAVESEELSPPPSPPPNKPRLKIKLKLPQVLSPNEPASRAASTPSGEPSQPPSRRGISKDIEIESEDDEEDEVAASSTRPMTSRQAVLASVVDSSHVSLSESSRKKKQLTESEIALRREETARKRKNLTEKKLEDEKMETINRLLKKQSKTKNKRNVLSTADERTPMSATPAVVQSARDGSEVPEAEVGEPVEDIPTMYRWVSTTRAPSTGDEDKMRLTFSVPVSLLGAARGGCGTRAGGASKGVCDVGGCGEVRKYRLVKDWRRGACGMEHLQKLEHESSSK